MVLQHAFVSICPCAHARVPGRAIPDALDMVCTRHAVHGSSNPHARNPNERSIRYYLLGHPLVDSYNVVPQHSTLLRSKRLPHPLRPLVRARYHLAHLGSRVQAPEGWIGRTRYLAVSAKYPHPTHSPAFGTDWRQHGRKLLSHLLEYRIRSKKYHETN